MVSIVHFGGSRLFLLTIVLLMASQASALGGFTVGFGSGLPSGGVYPLSVRLLQPVVSVDFGVDAFQFLVRADMAVPSSFDALPAIGVSAVTSSERDGVERYLGVGGGVSVIPVDDARLLWSAHALAGFRVPIAAGVAAAAEVHFVGNRLFVGPQVSLALEYSFGGER